ncbi:hypothetical protein PQ469_25370 [Mucilaginibacter sp. KACC 22773]|uniref:hypothetical protein n=1 Tax=Mucilaginibacter sp. KACC 22773 TaxID=3025671 RepID=UPI002365F145|nr:hypothetical protein [Mucilaginibacter sp. KACC 22773]WDF77220.1 hypothetical protein PQ469_25370 [Mucilaginibacter sp. KACC 22773]
MSSSVRRFLSGLLTNRWVAATYVHYKARSAAKKKRFISRSFAEDKTRSVDLVALKPGVTNVTACLPKEFDHRDWYGMYFRQETHVCADVVGPYGEAEPFMVLLHPELDWFADYSQHKQAGFLILVKHRFLVEKTGETLIKLPVFTEHCYGTFMLDKKQENELNLIFEKIWAELNCVYAFKSEYLAVLIMQIIHFTIKNFIASDICVNSGF